MQAGFQLASAFAVYGGLQLALQVGLAETMRIDAFSPWGFALSDRTRLVPGVLLGVQVL